MCLMQLGRCNTCCQQSPHCQLQQEKPQKPAAAATKCLLEIRWQDGVQNWSISRISIGISSSNHNSNTMR